MILRSFAAFALCLAASAMAQQPPAPAAPAPTYPVDEQGLANFNATCLPCRGFAQELRMYQDALIALRQEFAKRTAAMRALTDAGARGTVTPEQREKWKRDGEAAEKLETAISEMEAAEARAKKTLEACIAKYCAPPAPPPTPGGTLVPGGGASSPPAGSETAPPAGPQTAPPPGPRTAPRPGGAGATPPSPSPGGTPATPPPNVPGIPGTVPGAASSGPCDCDRYLREAASKDREAAAFEADQDKARRKQETSLQEQRALIASLRQANPGMSPRAILDHPDVKRLESAMQMAESDEGSNRSYAERARREAESARRAYLKCKDDCAAGPGPLGVVPGSPGSPAGPGSAATSAQSCDCEALLREAAKADAAVGKADEKIQETEAAIRQTTADIVALVALLKGVNPDLQTPSDHPSGKALQEKLNALRLDIDTQDKERNDAKAAADRLRTEYEACKKRCGAPSAPSPIGVLPPGTPAGGIDAPPPLDDFPFVGPEGPALQPTPPPRTPPQGPLSPAPGTPVAPVASGSPCNCGELRDRANAATEMAQIERRVAREASELERNAGDAALGLLASLRQADRATSEAQLLQHPEIQELKRKQQDAREEAARAKREAAKLEREAASLFAQYEKCVNECVPGEPPRLRTAINTGGNNPFGPNPLGGGTSVVTPPGNPTAPGSLQFSSSNYGGAEGGAVLITVVRTGGRRGAASVSYQTAGGNATAGADYQPVSGTLTWADGDDSPKSFSIALTEDGQVEPVETFNVSLSVFTGATPGSPLIAAVSIADKDSTSPAPAGSLQLSSSTYPTAEGAGAVSITVLRVNGNSGAVSVQYFTGPGSAIAGSDYQAVNGTLQWPSGDAGARTFTVPIIDDAETEQTETFFVTLNNPTGGATLGVPATATVSIQDNDLSTPIGPCGSLGNAWQPNAGGPYTCSGSCQPIPSSPMVTVNGDFVTFNPFHAGGAATFQGCGATINSQANNLIFFGQANHRATANRQGNNSYLVNVTSSGGGTCDYRCSKPGP